MYKILFVCHGNICRSPMAESVMKYLLENSVLLERVHVASAAAHTDEIGSQPHRGTRAVLAEKGIPLVPHRARLMTAADGAEYDLLIGMASYNVRDMKRIARGNEGKVFRLLDFTDHPRDIADPWYTGDFEETFSDIMAGCTALLERLKRDLV